MSTAIDLFDGRRGGVFGVRGGGEDGSEEAVAAARYEGHLAGCETCHSGAGWLCHLGKVLHDRWVAAAVAQT